MEHRDRQRDPGDLVAEPGEHGRQRQRAHLAVAHHLREPCLLLHCVSSACVLLRGPYVRRGGSTSVVPAPALTAPGGPSPVRALVS